ncbi:hypothetical protein [Cohnella nanjingensis]|uniref:Uncharacterized protein n=1 Tax=Cohnella nanjingensis TaxID=1387779 RepID=A0A7X0RTM4_9BACL|nr:hypothetical protein [Cohnella nanjingensis]MBB6671959.1 hypothetical protein [Cohnella nanjingensis]
MKPFGKEEKRIVVDGHPYHCVIDEIPHHERVSLRIYASKTACCEVLFTWKGNWRINLHKPKTLASLVRYAIAQGWDCHRENSAMKIEDGDLLIETLSLEA